MASQTESGDTPVPTPSLRTEGEDLEYGSPTVAVGVVKEDLEIPRGETTSETPAEPVVRSETAANRIVSSGQAAPAAPNLGRRSQFRAPEVSAFLVDAGTAAQPANRLSGLLDASPLANQATNGPVGTATQHPIAAVGQSPARDEDGTASQDPADPDLDEVLDALLSSRLDTSRATLDEVAVLD